jgi:hypothetical protein
MNQDQLLRVQIIFKQLKIWYKEVKIKRMMLVLVKVHLVVKLEVHTKYLPGDA